MVREISGPLGGTDDNKVSRRKSSDIDCFIGRRIKLRRVLLDYTQAELADRCFVSPQQIHKYELGLSKLSPARLDQLARALEVPVSWFFDEDPFDAGLPNDLMALLTDTHALKLLRLLRGLEDLAARDLLVRLAETVVSYRSSQQSGDCETPVRNSRIA
ncbi:MAG: helix-turn-helix domain-containing protein [Hyphomicrobiaceae bacterium]